MSIFETADVHLKGGECSLGSTYVYESASISVLLGLIMTKANFSGVLTNFYLLAWPSDSDEDIYNILKPWLGLT